MHTEKTKSTSPLLGTGTYRIENKLEINSSTSINISSTSSVIYIILVVEKHKIEERVPYMISVPPPIDLNEDNSCYVIYMCYHSEFIENYKTNKLSVFHKCRI